MRKSVIKAKLARGEPTLITTLHLNDAALYEMVGLLGFDGVWMDLEHHRRTLETAQELVRATRVGDADVVARPAKGEFMRLGRLLECGVTGILYPRCETAEEAAEVVRWAKFPPQGSRGFDGAGGDAPYGMTPMEEYVRLANEETFVAVQIEDEAGLDQVEKIAAVDGVDVIFLGPGDFTISKGITGQIDHPDVLEARRRIAAAVRQSGKHWGMPAASVETARGLLEEGARFLAHGADVITMLRAMEKIRSDFAGIGLTFRERPSV